MQRLVGILAIGVLFTLSTAQAGEKDEFFNGKDFAGFEGLIEKFWKIEDGAIVGSTAPKGIGFNTFLCSKKKYKDFELSFQVKLHPDGNSGIQIRSHIGEKKEDKENFAVVGPQCDMGQQYWGSLYGERLPGGMMKAADAKLVKEVLKVGEFNDYYIKAVGKHITIKLNGKTTVEGEFSKAPDEGIIAFQLHGGKAMDVTFKNIQFKNLTK